MPVIGSLLKCSREGREMEEVNSCARDNCHVRIAETVWLQGAKQVNPSVPSNVGGRGGAVSGGSREKARRKRAYSKACAGTRKASGWS